MEFTLSLSNSFPSCTIIIRLLKFLLFGEPYCEGKYTPIKPCYPGELLPTKPYTEKLRPKVVQFSGLRHITVYKLM